MRRDREDDAYEPEMPPLEGAGYLLDYLFEIGPGMSDGPITHEELRAWMGNTGVELQSWESRFLRRLSDEYLAEARRAEKRDCLPPWDAADIKPAVTDLQVAVRALANL